MPHSVGGAMDVTCITVVKWGYTRLNFIRQLRAGVIIAWQGTQQTVLQLLLRYSVEIYKCANTSELIS